jgi:uridylate kinase
MKIVLSLGGSLLTKELTAGNFKKYVDVLLKLKKEGHQLVVVTGGGSTCRLYRDIAKDNKADNVVLDRIGVVATHLNAMTLAACLGEESFPTTFRKPEEVKQNFGEKILVCGGDLPGHSTDYDAVLFADAIKADLIINATNVDGIYEKDPKKYPKAKKLKKLTFKQFEEIITQNEQKPGEYRLFDLEGAKLLRKIKVKMITIDGNNPQEIIRAVEGKHNGTVVWK